MRVRRTTADGDICFGHNANDYLVNTPEAVAQNVRTVDGKCSLPKKKLISLR